MLYLASECCSSLNFLIMRSRQELWLGGEGGEEVLTYSNVSNPSFNLLLASFCYDYLKCWKPQWILQICLLFQRMASSQYFMIEEEQKWNITITMQRSHLIHTVNIKIKNKTKPTTKKTRKTIIQFRGPNLPKANII